MALPILCMINLVKHIDDMLAVVKAKLFEECVRVFIVRSIWSMLAVQALANTLNMLLEVVFFAFIVQFQVQANGGKVIQYDFYIAILVAVVSSAVLLEVWRENLIDWIFAHNAAKLHKIIETQ